MVTTRALLLVFCVACAPLAGCFSINDLQSFPCANDKTCPSDFECVNQQCRHHCSGSPGEPDSACGAQELCTANYDGHGYCSPRCDSAAQCPNGLICTSEHTCVTCTSNNQCPTNYCCAADPEDSADFLGCRPSDDLPYGSYCVGHAPPNPGGGGGNPPASCKTPQTPISGTVPSGALACGGTVSCPSVYPFLCGSLAKCYSTAAGAAAACGSACIQCVPQTSGPPPCLGCS